MRGGDKREVGCGFPEEQFNGENSFVEGTKQILGNVGQWNLLDSQDGRGQTLMVWITMNEC